MKFNILQFAASFLFTSFLLGTPSQAVELDRLYPGYTPTVLSSFDDVQKVFDKMPTDFKADRWYNSGSQCFHRAQIWSYHFDRNLSTKAMKVFVFYTHTYKLAYHRMKKKKFDWWFHVSPYLLVKNASTGETEEWTVDATFADKPLRMKPWTDLFVETKRKCAEYVPFEIFKNEVQVGPDAEFGNEHCYIVRVPATDFSPVDVEARSSGKKTHYNWDYNDINEALQKAPRSRSSSYFRNLLGL